MRQHSASIPVDDSTPSDTALIYLPEKQGRLCHATNDGNTRHNRMLPAALVAIFLSTKRGPPLDPLLPDAA